MRLRPQASLCAATFLIAVLASGQGVIVNFGPTVAPIIKGGETPEGHKVAAAMDATILPWVDFSSADIADVVRTLNDDIKKQTPAGQKPLFISLPASLADLSAKSLFRREVSITLEKCPLSDVLLYICNQTGLQCEIVSNHEIQFYCAAFFEARQKTVERMANLTIDHVDFKQTGIEEVIDALNQKCWANAGQGDISLVLRPRPDDPPLAKIRRRTVTLKLDNARLLDLLQLITQQTDFEFTVEPDTVVIRPGRTDE